MNPLVLTLGGLVLFVAGLGLGFLMARRPGDRQAADELAVVKEDFEAYREGVTRHFRDSAGHFQAIGEQYRALYAHMADGAKHFCAGGPEQEAIEFAPQPELLSPEAGGRREPLTAAAAAEALSESPGKMPAEDDEGEVSSPPEWGAALRDETDEGETAAAEGERDESPDAGADETEPTASKDASAGGAELQGPPGDEPMQGPERRETQAPGSGMVH